MHGAIDLIRNREIKMHTTLLRKIIDAGGTVSLYGMFI